MSVINRFLFYCVYDLCLLCVVHTVSYVVGTFVVYYQNQTQTCQIRTGALSMVLWTGYWTSQCPSSSCLRVGSFCFLLLTRYYVRATRFGRLKKTTSKGCGQIVHHEAGWPYSWVGTKVELTPPDQLAVKRIQQRLTSVDKEFKTYHLGVIKKTWRMSKQH